MRFRAHVIRSRELYDLAKYFVGARAYGPQRHPERINACQRPRFPYAGAMQELLKRDPPPTHRFGDPRAGAPKAVIIGSGFGGLAAAIRLLKRGFRVHVFEQLEQPGGRARVYRQDGFTFDAGPTVITAPFLLEDLWHLAGRKLADDVDLRPVSPFYRIRFADGTWFDYTGDEAAMEAEVARISSADVEGYRRFVKASQEIYRVGFEKLAHVPFHAWTSMARIVPQMIKLESYRTVYGLVSRYIQHEQLRQVFSFHPLLVGGNPFTTTSIYSLILFLERRFGVHFPIGGTGALVRGMVQLIESMGGAVHCNAAVSQIALDGRRACGVRLSSGEHVAADVVVSNGDVAWTYRNLLPKHVRRRWTDRRIRRAKYSMSLFVWYFGTSRQYPDIAHHSILLGPRYRELLADIFTHHKLAEDFSLYLHRPTATDPALAPAGCDAFYVLSPVPHLQGEVDWRVAAAPYRDKIAAFLERTCLPQLRASIVTSRLLTPQHFQDELLSYQGAAFGMEPILTQSAYFRPHNQSEDIESLYFVGAGTHPGAGLPGVLSSARILDEVIPDAENFARP